MNLSISENDLLNMVNLIPATTGLPMTIWVSPRGRARHGPRIKVCMHHGDRMVARDTATVSVSSPPELIKGVLSSRDMAIVARWVEQNHSALLAFWADGNAAAFIRNMTEVK